MGIFLEFQISPDYNELCDANNLTFRELAAHYSVPQYYVDVPKDQNEESVYYVAEQFRELTVFLEDCTGNRRLSAPANEDFYSGYADALLKQLSATILRLCEKIAVK